VKLALELESDRIAPGERVIGRVKVLEGGPSRSVTLTLSFQERTQNCAATPYAWGIGLHEGELVTGQTLDFGFTIPPQAPPSMRGEHSELYWELDVHSDEPGLDTYARRRIEVVTA
jgi:hypothetical protein